MCDAVAIATGNDWRAIEAAAHVYAASGLGYRSLGSWSVDSQRNLLGRLEMPLKVGTVGGSLQSNPTVKDLLAVLNAQSTHELAEVMGAVGLAQNLAALRALVTDGIQFTLKAWKAIQDYDLERLGELMNKNQKMLIALKETSQEQNEMIQISLDVGAIGAKMTGGGGGGAVIAFCPQKEEAVISALKTAGYETLTPFIDPNTQNNKLPKSEHSITLTNKTDERLIVVNENDDVLDFLPRSQCHAGEGILHRAFSIHIFNERNQILLQQRSEQKQLWPFHWSNSCCSHPRVGETTVDAAQRRLREELGISVPLQYLYNFIYQARFVDEGSENELCSVYIGRSNGPVIIDKSEIATWRFIYIQNLESELNDHPGRFTPWFKMQWEQLRRQLDFNATDLGLS